MTPPFIVFGSFGTMEGFSSYRAMCHATSGGIAFFRGADIVDRDGLLYHVGRAKVLGRWPKLRLILAFLSLRNPVWPIELVDVERRGSISLTSLKQRVETALRADPDDLYIASASFEAVRRKVRKARTMEDVIRMFIVR